MMFENFQKFTMFFSIFSRVILTKRFDQVLIQEDAGFTLQ